MVIHQSMGLPISRPVSSAINSEPKVPESNCFGARRCAGNGSKEAASQ